MAFTWIEAFEIAVEVGSAVLADAALIQADQPASSPPVYATLDGNKYQAVLTLTPVKA